jgi:hypothetical protein
MIAAVAAFTMQAISAPAHGALIGTEAVVAAESRTANLARIDAVLARADVQQQLVAKGVDQEAARARVAALTDREVARLALDLESAPAGGDALGLIGAVFVILLILELTGVIDIFKKV